MRIAHRTLSTHFTHSKHSRLFAATAAALLVLTGCGDKGGDQAAPVAIAPSAASAASASVGSATGAMNPAPATAPAATTAANATPDAGEKLNVFVQCFNATNERAHKAMERYASWIKDIKVGPTGKERVIYGTYTVSQSSLDDCGKPMLDAAAEAPALPALDAAAKAYSSTVRAWGQTLATTDTYYSRENYKDDAMAGGKALHSDMVKNYDAYAQASRQFNQALEDVSDQRQKALLVEVEKTEGRKFNYWHLSTMYSAKQLVNLLEEDSFDVAEATARLKTYEDSADSLTAISKQPNSGAPDMWSGMDSSLESYRTAAKQRLRRVRDNTPYSSGDRMMMSSASGWMVDGSSAKLIRSYNELISSSNRAN